MLAGMGPVLVFLDPSVSRARTVVLVCATASVPIAAALVDGGFPAGAALVFLMAGPATNVATIGAIRRFLGGRALAAYLFTIVVGSVGLGITFDFLLEVVPTDTVHAHGTTSWWKVLSAGLFLALIARFAFEDLRGWLGRRRKTRVDEEVVEIGVDGMTCDGCVSKLETALLKEPGVSAVDVSLEDGKARVSGGVDKQRVRQAIVSVGFTPSTD